MSSVFPAPGAAATAAGTAPAASDLLTALTAGLAAGDDLGQLLLRFLDPLMHIAGASGGAVRVLDAHSGRMHLVGGAGVPAQVLAAERAVDPGCGVCGTALASMQPMWAEDLTPCANRSAGQYFGQDCRRVLAVPLLHRGRALGLFNLFFGDGSEPTGDVLSLLKTVGELLGLALHNARLERENLRATVLHERQALAADVHDSIGQSLAFVKMRLPLLQDAIRGGAPGDAERYFDDVRAAVGQAHSSLRSILAHFRAAPDPLGLAHALQGSATRFRRACAAVLELRNELPDGLLAPEQQVQVAHIVQEALLNVARHASASRAWVHLSPLQVATGPAVQVLVQDDGAGLGGPAAAAQADAGRGGTHYGLAIMRERATRLGGTLEVAPRPGGGTCVRLQFALQPAPAAEPD